MGVAAFLAGRGIALPWGISLHLTPEGPRVRVPATGADPVPVAVGDQVVELAPGSAQEFRL